MKITSTHIELALAAHFNYHRNYIIVNASWGMGLNYEADFLSVTPDGYATEVEIKVSKSDLLADLKKSPWAHGADFVKRVYFAVPTKLVKVCKEVLPEAYGIIEVYEGPYGGLKCREVRAAQNRPKARNLSPKEINNMLRLMSMRVWTLKAKILSLKQKK